MTHKVSLLARSSFIALLSGDESVENVDPEAILSEQLLVDEVARFRAYLVLADLIGDAAALQTDWDNVTVQELYLRYARVVAGSMTRAAGVGGEPR